MLDILLKTLLKGKDLCISLPNTENGKAIAACIDEYIMTHPNDFEKCIVFDAIVPKK